MARTEQLTEGDSDPRAFFVPSQDKLAWLFGVSPQTLRDWSAAGAPKRTTRGYSPRAWFLWLQATGRGRGKIAKQADPDHVSESEAKRRRALAQARRDEIRAAREAGEVIPVTEAREQRHAIIRWTIAAFDKAGIDLQALTRDRTVRAKVLDYFRRLRQEAADRADK